MSTVPSPQTTPGKPQLIAMVHVPSNNILQNTIYLDRLKLPTYSAEDVHILNNVRISLFNLFDDVLRENKLPYLEQCRSSVFIFEKEKTQELENQLKTLPFVQYLIDRALREVDIYTRNEINIVLIENIAAPYFIGDRIPFEDLLILHIICKSIREKYPQLVMGLHVLSSNEIESLPIAVLSNIYFMRSESSIFSGFRPEGRTVNNANLAKFYYLRNYLQAHLGIENPSDRRFPQIWSDLQKKHTVFETELMDIDTWLSNILFMKLEGVILTGAETGHDIDRDDLAKARDAIDSLKEKSGQYFGEPISIPLVSGSGLDMELYKQFVDYIITGTQLKKNKYWENEVDEENVKDLISRMH